MLIFGESHAEVAVGRTLGRLGVPTYLVAQQMMPRGESTLAPTWSSRYWSQKTRWDFGRPEAESVEFLLELGAKLAARHGNRAILLTLADWAAVFIERHAVRLQEHFVFPRAERPIVHTLANKWGMHLLAQKHHIPTPVTSCPQSLDEAQRFLDGACVPVVMKAADPSVADGPEMRIATSRQAIIDELRKREAEGLPLNVVLQEYIPGEADSVWMCNACFGSERDRAVIFTGRKLREIWSGVASLAVCVPNDTVAMQTRRFMEGVGYRGCVGIGYRYDRRDGRYKLLDVNARVSGVFRLFAGTNGMDVVRVCYLQLTGQPVPATALQPGRKWLLEDDLPESLGAIRSGHLRIADWMRSLRGVRELNWFAADDPLPGLLRFRDWIRV